MTVVISIVFLAASLLNVLIFKGSPASSIIVAVLSAGLLGFKISYGRKSGKVIRRLVSVPVVAAFIVLSFTGGMQQTGAGLLYYDGLAAKASGLIKEGSYYKALAIINEIEQTYGRNDMISILKARASIGQEKYTSAGQALSEVAGRTSPEYYKVMGYYYYVTGEYAKARGNFIEAAAVFPFWEEARVLADVYAADRNGHLVERLYSNTAVYPYMRVNTGVAGYAAGYAVGSGNIVIFQDTGYPGVIPVDFLNVCNTEGSYIRMTDPRDAAAYKVCGTAVSIAASKAYSAANIFLYAEVKGYNAAKLAHLAAGILKDGFAGNRFIDWVVAMELQ